MPLLVVTDRVPTTTAAFRNLYQAFIAFMSTLNPLVPGRRCAKTVVLFLIWTTTYGICFLILPHLLGPAYAVRFCRPAVQSATSSWSSFAGQQDKHQPYLSSTQFERKLETGCEPYFRLFCSSPECRAQDAGVSHLFNDSAKSSDHFHYHYLQPFLSFIWPSFPTPPRAVMISTVAISIIQTLLVYNSVRLFWVSRRLGRKIIRVEYQEELIELHEFKIRRLAAELERARGDRKPARVGDFMRLWPVDLEDHR